jgi:hypothetical protein
MGGYIEGYICRKTGKKIDADINAALNIARKLGCKIKITKKIKSLVTHSGVKPLNPLQRANTRDPEVRNPALKGGEKVIRYGYVFEGSEIEPLVSTQSR